MNRLALRAGVVGHADPRAASACRPRSAASASASAGASHCRPALGPVVGDRLQVELDVGGPLEIAQGVEPAPLLEVADQDDPARHPAGLLAGVGRRPRSRRRRRSAPGPGRSPPRSGASRPAGAGPRPAAARGRASPTPSKPSSGREADVEGEDGQLVAGPARRRSRSTACAFACAQRSPRRMLALVSISTATRCRSTSPRLEAGRLAEERPGEGQGQQREGRRPQQEQQPVVQPAPARQARGRRRRGTSAS